MTMSGVRSLCSAGEAAGGVASGMGLGAEERAAARAFITEVASAWARVTRGMLTLLLGAFATACLRTPCLRCLSGKSVSYMP